MARKLQIERAKNSKDKQQTYAKFLGIYKQSVEQGYYGEAELIVYAYMEDRLRALLYYIEAIDTRDVIEINEQMQSHEISSLKEAALYAFDGTSAIYSLSGLPKTGKALSASEKAKGPLVTLRPTTTPRPALQPVTPSPDAQAELTRKMQEIRDSVSPGETMPTLRGKLFIAVFDEKDKLFLTSSSYDWTHASLLATYIHGIPEERLARGIEDADTMILVYRKLSEVGTYEYGIYNEDKGYAAYTMVAAIYRGKVQTFSSHVSWPPNVKHTKGSAYGTYEYKTALNDIRNAKWESLGPGGK